MSPREFDIVIYGATGYTGEHVARALSKMAAPGGSWRGVKWAIAGRSATKLAAITEKWDLKPTGTILADNSDDASLIAMAARGAVVMNAVGPYRFYGEAVVKACISTGTDYTDLCGEPEFIDRCLLKHADAARAAGVVIVHACAFDSVPADIGTLFTAMQFPPPMLCGHADMYHTISIEGNPTGAYAHATTFYAAVHGFGGANETRKQRKSLLAKLEADAPGSSKPPTPLGPKLRVAVGPAYKAALKAYSFLFPGSDVAVVRTSQRTLARIPSAANEPYLTPQFGASFTIKSPVMAFLVALTGLTFNTLSGYKWGRSILLKNPKLFTIGAFTDEGPTEEMLSATSWRSVFFGYGWSEATTDKQPNHGFDRKVVCSVSGPEPGYIGTALMYLQMARFVREERPKYKMSIDGGVYTPGGLVGSGGPNAIKTLIDMMGSVGITFAVDEPLTAMTPKPLKPKGGEEKRPKWQSALNILAFVGWCGVLSTLIYSWPDTIEWGSPLLTATILLESVCAFEVVQIALGMARGNLPLGVVLHYTRLMECLLIMPSVPTALSVKLVLLAWSVTEVCRYPMFLLPQSGVARMARYLAPIVTFPLGAGAEAMCAYLALTPLRAGGYSSLLSGLVKMIVPVNLLGGLGAYGGLVKKGLASLKPAAKEKA